MGNGGGEFCSSAVCVRWLQYILALGDFGGWAILEWSQDPYIFLFKANLYLTVGKLEVHAEPFLCQSR